MRFLRRARSPATCYLFVRVCIVGFLFAIYCKQKAFRPTHVKRLYMHGTKGYIFRVATHIVRFFSDLSIRTIKDTTLWLSPLTPKVERFFFCAGSHLPPVLCASLQIVAFIIAKFATNYNLIISKLQGKYLQF